MRSRCKLISFIITLIVVFMSIVIKKSYALTSSSYVIKNNTIYAIPTTFDYKYDELLGNIKYNNQLQVYNNNELVNEDDSIGTGYKLSINNNYYDIVLLGDITGDGKIQLGDISALYNHYKNNKTIDGLKLEAGKLTNDDKVTLGDVSKLYNFYKGNKAFTYYSDNDILEIKQYIDKANNYYKNSANADSFGTNIINELNISNKEDSDQLVLTRDGNVELAIKKHNKCYRKSALSEDIEIIDDELCEVDITDFASNGKQLHVRDGKLYNSNNKEVRLHGVSLEIDLNSKEDRYSTKAIHTLKNWGTNLYRVFVSYNLFNKDRDGYVLKLYDAIDHAIENDMYVLVNWNPKSNNLPEDAINLFEKVARKYPNDPHIIYEIWNEPGINSWEIIKEYSNKLIPAIRAISGDAIIVVPTYNNDARVDVVINDELPYGNLMYTFHNYTEGFRDSYIKNLVAAIEAKVPVFVTEWAATDSGTPEGDFIDEIHATAFAKILDKYNLSYSYFCAQDGLWSYAFTRSNVWNEKLPEYMLNQNAKFYKRVLRKDYNNNIHLMSGDMTAGDSINYRSNKYRENIVNIEFVNSTDVPSNVIDTFDLSLIKDNSIKGYIINAQESGKYSLIVSADGIINAPVISNYLFAGMTNLKSIDLSNFYTTRVTSMANMFGGDEKLESLDLSNFDTSRLKNIQQMFENNKKLTSLNLSNWNAHLTNIWGAFNNMYEIENLDLRGLLVDNINSFDYVFAQCKKLKNLNISTWNPISVTKLNNFITNAVALENVDMSEFSIQDDSEINVLFKNAKDNAVFIVRNEKMKNKFESVSDANVIFRLNTDVDSGISGNTTWKFNHPTNTLTIAGTGNMENYSLDNLAPWYKYKKYIEHIIVNEDVTSLGDYSFYELDEVLDITINAKNLSDLTKLNVNEGNNFVLYHTGNRYGASLIFGENVTKVPSHLMMPTTYGSDKTNITSIEFKGDKIKTIGNFGLSYLKAAGLVLKESVTSVGGLSFGYGSEYIIILPNSLVSVGNWSIHSIKNLETIVFGPVINTIEDNTINANPNLKTLVMPHINNTSLKSSKIFESTIGHDVYVYGDSSTQEWLNNIISASGQTNLIYKPISDYKLSVTSNTDISTQVGYNGSFTFTTNKNVNAYYTYTTNDTTYIIGNVDIEKNGNTYTINNIKNDIYIEVE